MPLQETPSADVLVVDDDYAIREMLVEILEDAGFTVSAAEHGASALTLLRQSSDLPRIILLDLMMPVMSGWEFRKEQQNDPKLSTIPVVALSARPNLQHEAFTMTVEGFIRKPIDVPLLLDIVERYCA